MTNKPPTHGWVRDVFGDIVLNVWGVFGTTPQRTAIYIKVENSHRASVNTELRTIIVTLTEDEVRQLHQALGEILPNRE